MCFCSETISVRGTKKPPLFKDLGAEGSQSCAPSLALGCWSTSLPVTAGWHWTEEAPHSSSFVPAR